MIEFETATNWRVSYDHATGVGRAAHRSEPDNGKPFTVTRAGSVLFRTVDAVPHAVIEAVARRLEREGLSFGHLPLPSGVREWAVPFEPRMINDMDPGYYGPSCAVCASFQADRMARAEACPMLTGSDGKPYRSPHAGTYLFEARFIRFQCTQGVHGGVRGA